MRRASFIGPLILIGLGGLFLIHNLRPDLPIIDFMAQYWPFLLIGWGALRLVEVMFLAMADKPLPTAGLSVAEWTMVVLIVVFGSGAYVVRGHSWWPPGRITMGGLEVFGEAYDFPVSGQKTTSKAPRIVIESFRGNARVVGSDTNEVKITGRKTIRSMQQKDADKANLDTPVELVQNGDEIIVRTNQDRIASGMRVTADLELAVPKGSSVTARGRYGDFDITDITGSVDINSDNAGVRLQNIGGDVRIETRRSDIIRATAVKGRVEVKGRGSDVELQSIEGPVAVEGTYVSIQFRNLAKPVRFEGPQSEFTAERVNGQVRISLSDLNGEKIVGPIRFSARSRDVQLNDFTGNLEISLDRGDVELRPAATQLGKIDLRTRAGNIEMIVPEKAKFELSATTDRGEISNDYGTPFHGESAGRGGILKGSTGDGPKVTLSTSRGSITVRRATAGDESSTFPNIPSGDGNSGNPPKPPKPPVAPKVPKAEEQ